MANDEKRTDWTDIEKALDKKPPSADVPARRADTVEVLPPSVALREEAQKIEGMIGQWRLNKLERNAVLIRVKALYEKQLDLVLHQADDAVRVKKAESSLVAEQFLRSLDSKHLEYLTKLGLRNEDVRAEALKQLGDQTSRHLKDVHERDWPDSIRQQTLSGIFDRHRKFFEKLTQELGEDTSRK